MPSAEQFQGLLSSVIPSQDSEVIIGKQPVLSEHSREVRTALNAMPPDVSRGIIAEYSSPAPAMIASMENAIISRELAIENAGQEQNLDQQWLADGGKARGTDENNAGADDPWNALE
jgi:hypothetical protein